MLMSIKDMYNIAYTYIVYYDFMQQYVLLQIYSKCNFNIWESCSHLAIVSDS